MEIDEKEKILESLLREKTDGESLQREEMGCF